MKTIKLSKDLALPAHEIATSVWAAIGNRGSGKSNLAAAIAEGIMDAGIPVVVIDQVGPWFSLRLEPDGKTPSRFQIPVLGGNHGDIVLLPGAGRQVAEALAASASSAVLDISMMGKGERIRFCADFAEAFFEAKKRNPGPVCLLLEEAQRLVPQVVRTVSPDIMRCLGAFEEMFEVGRNFGIGGGLLTLRPQKVNKDCLNLAETVFAFRATGALERKAIATWVQEKDAPGRNEVSGELPSLPIGTAIVWSPGLFDIYGHFKLALKSTFDASSTPGTARAAVKMKALDLGDLESKMEAVVAAARENDPKILKAKVAELQRQLAARTPEAAKAAPAKVETRTITQDVIPDGVRVELDQLGISLKDAREHWVAMGADLNHANKAHSALNRIVDRSKIRRTPIITSDRPDPNAAMKAANRAAAIAEDERRRSDSNHASVVATSIIEYGKRLGAGERAVLTAAAQHASGVSREQLTVLTGYRRSSRDTYLQKLKAAGLVGLVGDRYHATTEGAAALGGDFKPLPTGDELREHWLSNGRLGEGERKILALVAGRFPGGMTRDEISAATDYKRSSRDTYLQKLAARRLIENAGGTVTASETLFS